MQNNCKLFLNESNFISLDTSGTNMNIIEVGYLKYALPSDNTDKNLVVCSFRGVELQQIKVDKIDDILSGGSFCYVSTSNNLNTIKLVVSKTEVLSTEDAKKYITGMLVDYILAPLSYSGSNNIPLYVIKTYLSDKTLVSETTACKMDEVFKKIQIFEANLNINSIGYYEHTIERALIQG